MRKFTYDGCIYVFDGKNNLVEKTPVDGLPDELLAIIDEARAEMDQDTRYLTAEVGSAEEFDTRYSSL